MLALEGRFEVFTIGRDTEWEKVKEIYKLGLKHGMKLSAISGVKGVYSDDDIAKVVALAKKARRTWKGGSDAAPVKPAAAKAAPKKVAKKPVAEKPVAAKPAAKKPAATKPAAKKPAAKKASATPVAAPAKAAATRASTPKVTAKASARKKTAA